MIRYLNKDNKLDRLTKNNSVVLFLVIVVLFLITGCEDDNVPSNVTVDVPFNDFVSSLDTTLVHLEDEYEAIFIENISYSLNLAQYNALKEITFRILPKTGSTLVEELIVTYSKEDIISKGYFDSDLMQITFPVFGLYDGYLNKVSITNIFSNDRKWEKTITIETDQYPHSEIDNMKLSSSKSDLGLSYMVLETKLGAMIMDVEGNIRWAANEFLEETNPTLVYLDNYFYSKKKTSPFNELIKLGFDGSIETISVQCGDYPGAVFHHEMSLGKNGFLLELNIKDGDSFVKKGSVLIEVDKEGKLLETWDLDDIIGKVLIETGVPVDTFVRNAINHDKAMDWFHMNSMFYDASDNTILISSRENFVIKVGYSDKEIKWILGDTTKFWYTIDALNQYALNLTGGNINIGQHSLSIVENRELLMFNNGENSRVSFFPKDKLGAVYEKSMVSGYSISSKEMTANETFNFKLPFFCPNRGFVQKWNGNYIVTSLPIVADYNSVIGIYNNEGKLLLDIKNSSYFCVRASGFSNRLYF